MSLPVRMAWPQSSSGRVRKGLRFFLKVFGTADLLIGISGMLLTDFFTVAAVLIYLGLASWAFECWLAQDVATIAKAAATVFIAALTAAFT